MTFLNLKLFEKNFERKYKEKAEKKKNKKDPKGSQVPEAVRQHQMQVDKVEGIRCGRHRACQRGKHQVSPNHHQVYNKRLTWHTLSQNKEDD